MPSIRPRIMQIVTAGLFGMAGCYRIAPLPSVMLPDAAQRHPFAKHRRRKLKGHQRNRRRK